MSLATVEVVSHKVVVEGKARRRDIHVGHVRGGKPTRFIPDVIKVIYVVVGGRVVSWSVWIEGPRVLVDDSVSARSRSGAYWFGSHSSTSVPAPDWVLEFVEENRPYEMAA